MSTPSTCVQFKPGSREFALGDEAPGYRYLRLGSGGDIETRVQRVTAAWPGPGITPG
jgi:Icc protein